MNQMNLSFQENQAIFCEWLRSPDATPPANVQPERMQIYRELLYNNVSSFIEIVYPVTRSLLPTALWESICQDFFAQAQCQSPFYNDISLQFREYLVDTQHSVLNDRPWLTELLQFEWLELYLDTAEIELKVVDKNLIDHWQLSLSVWVLVYQYPVYHWYEGMSADEIEPQLGAIMTWRDLDDQVCIEVISPLYAILINELNERSISDLELQNILKTQIPSLEEIDVQNTLADLKSFLEYHQILNA